MWEGALRFPVSPVISHFPAGYRHQQKSLLHQLKQGIFSLSVNFSPHSVSLKEQSLTLTSLPSSASFCRISTNADMLVHRI